MYKIISDDEWNGKTVTIHNNEQILFSCTEGTWYDCPEDYTFENNVGIFTKEQLWPERFKK